MSDIAPSERARVKRHHERGAYDFDSIAAILDAAFLCHVGYVINDQPYVTPTSYWRENEVLYWHGSSASRMLRTLEKGIDCCFTVTILDGLVLARSAFNHSVNYRSVMLFGRAQRIDDDAEKRRQLEMFVERMYPGRWSQLRPVTAQEIKATTVLSMQIEEGAAKVRSGPPKDDAPDYDWPIWAGVVPVRSVVLNPQPDAGLKTDIAAPSYLDEPEQIGLRAKERP
jgi:nitroimidazol reductase NimA-like FMN-containing flavoprotein (pyridoxamine 5'-phosphate oxidase superfamily)